MSLPPRKRKRVTWADQINVCDRPTSAQRAALMSRTTSSVSGARSVVAHNRRRTSERREPRLEALATAQHAPAARRSNHASCTVRSEQCCRAQPEPAEPARDRVQQAMRGVRRAAGARDV